MCHQWVRSQHQPNVAYRLEQVLGIGGMGTAFLATRRSGQGDTRVVIKMQHASWVRTSAKLSELSSRKEVVALERINQRVPATPFVVRLMDQGSTPAMDAQGTVNLTWLALEYVHGGPEGTTLEERVERCIRHTGQAFDMWRTAGMVRALGSGLAAVHDESVVHRDLKPANILCCGYGTDEMFKISDFGVSRAQGVQGTFGNMSVGTPGFAAPEQFGQLESYIGSWTDVFALACIVYYALTGDSLFNSDNMGTMLVEISKGQRRKISEGTYLCEGLRSDPHICESIDEVIYLATRKEPKERIQSGETLATLFQTAMGAATARAPDSTRARSFVSNLERTKLGSWQFTQQHGPCEGLILRHVAWNSDGRCLALANNGLLYWDSVGWQDAPVDGYPHPETLNFVRRMGPGRWMLGGQLATLANYTASGFGKIVQASDTSLEFRSATGDLNDLAVILARSEGSPPQLLALCGGRWLKPYALEELSVVTALSRFEEERWLLAGRGLDGKGYCALYDPLSWELQPLMRMENRAMLDCKGLVGSGTGVAVGTNGQILYLTGSRQLREEIDPEADLSACALDASGRVWAASRGALWMREPGVAGIWENVWRDETWSAPFVSIVADVGQLHAVTANGAVLSATCELEGRGVNSIVPRPRPMTREG